MGARRAQTMTPSQSSAGRSSVGGSSLCTSAESEDEDAEGEALTRSERLAYEEVQLAVVHALRTGRVAFGRRAEAGAAP